MSKTNILKYNMGNIENKNDLYTVEFPHIHIVVKVKSPPSGETLTLPDFMRDRYININEIVNNKIGLAPLTVVTKVKIKTAIDEKLKTIKSGEIFLCVANDKIYLCCYG